MEKPNSKFIRINYFNEILNFRLEKILHNYEMIACAIHENY